MNIDDLTIGEVKQLAGMCMQMAAVVPETTGPITDDDEQGLVRIIVLQRGWVAVGRFYQIGSACRLESAGIIRRWGTTKGLGELAEKGPLPDTKLDQAGLLRFHELTIVVQFECVQGKWGDVC